MHGSYRCVYRVALLAFVVALLLCPLARPPVAGAETVQNAAGRYDGLVLRDLGGKTAALVQMVSADGAFTPVQLWRSKKGAFDMRRATFVAGDVNGDGIGDGIVLYDLGRSRSRLLVYISDGTRARQKTAWTSKKGAFARSRARLAVADLNRDGLDDLVALYRRGKTGATLFRFISTGAKYRQSKGWTARRGYAWAWTQLAAGDVTGDGRDDAIVLYKSTRTSSRLDVFVAGSSRFKKRTFWRGRYPAGRARLAAGDVDSDGDCDAVCLRSGRLEVFRSNGRALGKPTRWATGVPGVSRFCVGDVSGDGRADAVLASSAGTGATHFTVWASSGTSFVAQAWCTGAWSYSCTRLGVAPSTGLVVSDDAEVLSDASRRYLEAVEEDGTLTFADMTGQVARLRPGDVLLSAADATFPEGLCRKVTGVSEAGGEVVVETEEATLTDVIEDGEIAFGGAITGDDLPDDGVVDSGTRLTRGLATPGTLPASLGSGHTEGFGFDLTTSLPLPGETLDTVQIEGSVWLDPDFYCSCEISGFGIESASLTETVSTETDLTVSLQRDFIDKEIKKTIFKRTLSVITIMVGPVPVVVTPEFEVYVGAEGTVTAGVSAGMSLETQTTVGVSYDDGDWDTIQTSTYDLTPQQPQLFGSLSLTGFAGAGLAFKFYAVAGPEAKLQPYVSLEAGTNQDPWWSLKAGLDAKVGFKVEVLSAEIMSQDFDLHLFEYVIAQAGDGGSGGDTTTYQSPSIRGKILDASSGQPVKFAWVEADRGGPTLRETHAAADGTYVFSGLAPGSYTVTAGKSGYADNTRSVAVTSGQTTLNQNVSLSRLESQGVRGRVLADPGGAPVHEAYVSIREESDDWWLHWPFDGEYVGVDGSYEFLGVPPGTYRIVGSAGYHFYDSIVVTVGAGQMLENRDLHPVPYGAQGISGTVVDAYSSAPVSDATVEMHAGSDAPAGPVEGSSHSAADGSFGFTGLEVGDYTLVVRQDGYTRYVATVAVTRATITALGQIRLRESGGQSMRSAAGACIRWEEGVSSAGGTFQFWYRPLTLYGTEYGSVVAEITYDYPDWNGGGLARFPAMVITYREVPTGVSGTYHTVFGFILTEDEDSGDPGEPGTYHQVFGTTTVTTGTWYHIVAQYGSGGMKLFVNGHLEASQSYAGHPEAFAGAEGGWFSLGEYYREGQGRPNTAGGDYKGLCVSEWQVYDGDFTPLDPPYGWNDAVIFDGLAGMTNGENLGFVATP